MQNRYAGDIGDFSKFSLLLGLFKNSNHRIGLIWYTYPCESHNNDGLHINYLSQPQYQYCDPSLTKRLHKVVNNERSIKALETSQILPKDTIYFSNTVEFSKRFPGQSLNCKNNRIAARQQWIEQACQVTEHCDVVVLDPDNGMEIKSVPHIHQKKSGKYAYYHEIGMLFKDKPFAVIYQHLNRSKSHQQQICERAHALKQHINFTGTVFALRFQPYSPRAYFILARQKYVIFLRKQVERYLDGLCGFGWDCYYELS